MRNLSDVVVGYAKSQIGCGESGRNNCGPDVDEYRRGGPVHGPWCAAFVCWCFEQTFSELKKPMPFKRTHGARALFRRIKKAGGETLSPEVGGVACWSRGKKNSWTGHIGIVTRVNGSNFKTIEGNRGRFPSFVREYDHEVGEAGLLGFASLKGNLLGIDSKDVQIQELQKKLKDMTDRYIEWRDYARNLKAQSSYLRFDLPHEPQCILTEYEREEVTQNRKSGEWMKAASEDEE
jgi:hypothetical protein